MRDEEDGERTGVRRLLGPGRFRILLIGQSVSSIGDWVGTLALIAAAFDLTGSSTAVGIVLVLRLLPPLLAAPVGGILADRVDRRLIMVVTNLCMAALISLVPFVGIGLLFAIAFASESFAMLFLPARDAAVPDLVPEASLPSANGLVMAGSYGAIPFAAALFSGLRLLSGNLPTWVPLHDLFADHPLAIPFFFDAATFVFAAAMIARIRMPRGEGRSEVGILRGVADAARVARANPAIRGLAAGVGVAMLGGGALFAVGIAYVRRTIGGGDVEFGFLVSLWGLGMATGLGTVQLLVRRGEPLVFRVAVFVCGAVLLVMALFPAIWLAFLAAWVFGAAFAVAVMLAVTLVQRIASEEMRGRLLAGAHMLFRLALAIGAVGIGWLATAVETVSVLGFQVDGNRLALALGGLLIVLGALAAGGVSRAGEVTSPGDPPGPGPG